MGGNWLFTNSNRRPLLSSNSSSSSRCLSTRSRPGILLSSSSSHRHTTHHRLSIIISHRGFSIPRHHLRANTFSRRHRSNPTVVRISRFLHPRVHLHRVSMQLMVTNRCPSRADMASPSLSIITNSTIVTTSDNSVLCVNFLFWKKEKEFSSHLF